LPARQQSQAINFGCLAAGSMHGEKPASRALERTLQPGVFGSTARQGCLPGNRARPSILVAWQQDRCMARNLPVRPPTKHTYAWSVATNTGNSHQAGIPGTKPNEVQAGHRHFRGGH